MKPKTKRLQKEAIERAIDICGTPDTLAAFSEVSVAAIYHWRNGVRKISPQSAIKIEAGTAGKVTRAELRPDIFGE